MFPRSPEEIWEEFNAVGNKIASQYNSSQETGYISMQDRPRELDAFPVEGGRMPVIRLVGTLLAVQLTTFQLTANKKH